MIYIRNGITQLFQQVVNYFVDINILCLYIYDKGWMLTRDVRRRPQNKEKELNIKYHNVSPECNLYFFPRSVSRQTKRTKSKLYFSAIPKFY